MKLLPEFLALLAVSATQFVAAGPIVTGELPKRSAVGVKTLKCDGYTYKCTADLKSGDGKWIAGWPTPVSQETLR
ncbi:hypothetical protein BDZ94DRAFT_1310291 [Collybia nuda]|uniref:Uncharacterized protein n=1 Tax=Collybia nuda TaxID=64659 RepID=A0A9P6CDJ1_9AGAR|nr:hypothetical protein BDZ94DRAFT_1310291 [Collybia nuda]